MKKIIFTLVLITAFTSCKNEKKSKNDADLVTLKGNFFFYGDAAVLQTDNEIYGVFINDKVKDLNEMAETYKKKPTDMVLAEVKGIVSTKKDSIILWEKKLEVVEILKVSETKQNESVITIGQ